MPTGTEPLGLPGIKEIPSSSDMPHAPPAVPTCGAAGRGSIPRTSAGSAIDMSQDSLMVMRFMCL